MLAFTADKKGQILQAALEVFLTYGFRKTSMDDIARAASMSRPGLYNNFRNKTDIFRALVELFCDTSLRRAKAELDGTGDFASRLTRAIEVSIVEMNAVVESAPHGSELMNVNEEIAADLERSWSCQFKELLTHAFAGAEEKGEINLVAIGVTPAEAASVFDNTIEGLRQKCLRGEMINEELGAAIRFFAGAMSARSTAKITSSVDEAA